MAGPGEDAARDGLNILLEMASERGGLSRSALQQRCGLNREKLSEALASLSKSGLVARRSGPRGRYHLTKSPESTSVGHLQRTLIGRRGQARAVRTDVRFALAKLDQDATLADLTRAIDEVETTVCPYVDACVALGCPSELVLRSGCACRPHC
jgi:DNA-binding IscR family transcriptional regulator